MASLISYTKLQLIQRVKQHIADGFPDSEFSTTDREVLLYIDQAAAATLIGQAYNNAKIEGNIAVGEAWYTTYLLPDLAQDSVSGYWYTTLPQPPVNLPLGYSISRAFFAQAGYGQGNEIYLIESKRVGYRKNLPMPTGSRGWVEGSKFWVAASDGSSLYQIPVYVTMANTRTESLTETLNLPDDAIEMIFQNVTTKLIQRMQLPKDIIQDDISSGNKTS